MTNRDTDPEGYLFFWGHQPSKDGTITQSCLSQWYPCRFVEDGKVYNSAEQYMMAAKARLFGDDAALARIMSATSPRDCKRLGRSIKGFSEELWKAKRFDIVVLGNCHKFGQNLELGEFLMNTGNKTLVEASPYDRIWGVGMSADDPRINDPRNWRGMNLLGFALMSVRDYLRKRSEKHEDDVHPQG